MDFITANVVVVKFQYKLILYARANMMMIQLGISNTHTIY